MTEDHRLDAENEVSASWHISSGSCILEFEGTATCDGQWMYNVSGALKIETKMSIFAVSRSTDLVLNRSARKLYLASWSQRKINCPSRALAPNSVGSRIPHDT